MSMLETARQTRTQLAEAVHKNSFLSMNGMQERLFTFLFSELVYPQIWEDPVVDMDAICLCEADRMIAIASGGCNIMSYLTARPRKIIAVDLNNAHIALINLKIAALQKLPNYSAFSHFFINAADQRNVSAYDELISAHLPRCTQDYWNRRDMLGRRFITRFSRGFYRYGLLGTFIGAAHFLSKMHGREISSILHSKSIEEQVEFFDKEIKPIFFSWIVQAIVRNPASLYGLGIPPSQYQSLASNHENGIIGALIERIRRLSCDFPIKENYFAQQAFGRSYIAGADVCLPPYLQKKNYELIKPIADRIEIRQTSITEQLSQMPSQSLDAFVLLDAQDWMDNETLNALWTQIDRTASARARLIFRTAANEMLLPGRVDQNVLSHWRRNNLRSEALHAQDRSAIYGAFHLYERA